MSDKKVHKTGAKIVKTAEALNGAEAVAAVLETLNPPTAGNEDWNFSELAVYGGVDDALNASVFGLCQAFGLGSSRNQFIQTVITVISYATLMEGAQHIIGITSGLGKIDFNGIALAQISQKLDRVIVLVGLLVGEPLKSAKDFLTQAQTHIRNGNITRAVKCLEQVNINATKARNLIDQKGDEKLMVEALVSSTQVKIN